MFFELMNPRASVIRPSPVPMYGSHCGGRVDGSRPDRMDEAIVRPASHFVPWVPPVSVVGFMNKLLPHTIVRDAEMIPIRARDEVAAP